MLYRKKPVTICAWPVRTVLGAALNDWQALHPKVKAAYEKGELIFLPGEIRVSTLEGNMAARLDDWLICGVKGEFYPCKHDIFEATYEPA